jgi:hypothetical protein
VILRAWIVSVRLLLPPTPHEYIYAGLTFGGWTVIALLVRRDHVRKRAIQRQEETQLQRNRDALISPLDRRLLTLNHQLVNNEAIVEARGPSRR